jgi:hypothetical protein
MPVPGWCAAAALAAVGTATAATTNVGAAAIVRWRRCLTFMRLIVVSRRIKIDPATGNMRPGAAPP